MTSQSRFLSEQVRVAHRGPAWHGSSIAENLDGLGAEEAAARPVPEGHSIWEIVLHMTGWTEEVERRLRGSAPSLPERGDWPAVGVVSDAAWVQARAALANAHETLAAAIERFADDRWDSTVGDTLNQPLGTGVTYAAMVAGLVQHDAYHGGQVGLLRKALRV
jgi:uncharacterized damage-inducible protein DinB